MLTLGGGCGVLGINSAFQGWNGNHILIRCKLFQHGVTRTPPPLITLLSILEGKHIICNISFE